MNLLPGVVGDLGPLAAIAVKDSFVCWAGAGTGAFCTAGRAVGAGGTGDARWASWAGRSRREETIALMAVRSIWCCLNNSVSPRIWAAIVAMVGVSVGIGSTVSTIPLGLGGEGGGLVFAWGRLGGEADCGGCREENMVVAGGFLMNGNGVGFHEGTGGVEVRLWSWAAVMVVREVGVRVGGASVDTNA